MKFPHGLARPPRRRHKVRDRATLVTQLHLEAQLLAIVAGLQEGIEDLLAGRVYHPKKEDRLKSLSKPVVC